MLRILSSASMQRYPLWKCISQKTNLPLYRGPVVRDIRRTHHELVKLQDHLIYANPECFVPALPPAITSAGAGTEEDERRIKNDIQKWLDVIGNNPILMRDEEIMLFVQSDFGVLLLMGGANGSIYRFMIVVPQRLD